MITIPLDDTGTRHLMDREALADWVFVSEITVRRHCKPTKRDPESGRLFYEAEACREILEKVIPRRKRCADGISRRTRT